VATTLTLERGSRGGTGARIGAIGIRVSAVLAALLVGFFMLALTGHNPWSAYQEMAVGALGSTYAIEQTLTKTIPLLMSGLGVSLAFTAGLWNVGAEGQMAVGAIAATWLALRSEGQPAALIVPVVLLVGAVGGAGWATIPAILRVVFGINELLSTLMLNYVAQLWVDYLVFGPWADPAAFTFPYSRAFPANARLPYLLGNIHLGLLVALMGTLILLGTLRHTPWGYEVRIMGASSRTARYLGIPFIRNVVVVMAISGSMAGLAGAMEVTGVLHRLQQGVAQGYGYAAIIVAWVAQLRLDVLVLVATFIAALLNGGFAIQTAGVPAAIAAILQALILIFLLGSEYWLKRVQRHRAIKAVHASLGRERRSS
jgi:ABC-type uncharacterized transport system permease subunit